VRVEKLPLGRHSISASLAGHSVVRQSVELTRQTPARVVTLALVSVAAAPLMGVLSISSTPAGAGVTLDGRPVGSTPSRLDVSAGRHLLTVEQDGYAPMKREITVVAGEREAIAVTLEPLVPPSAPEGPVAFDRVEVKPRQIGGTQNPEYPPVARLARQTGAVVLRWVVDERGSVTDIEVVQSTAKVFENAVLGWIRDLRFEPGRQAGQAVPVTMSRRFRFEMSR
jgi:TonB family protein